MARATKTIAFPLPPLASIADATVTNFEQITVDLPESSKTFRKVWIDFMCNDRATTAGNAASWRLGARVNSSAYTTVTNENVITNSGENMSIFFSQDFTSLFVSAYSGTTTSATVDVQCYVDSTAVPATQEGASAILWVTYEYDDTSTTLVGNAWIPMNSLDGKLPTSKSTIIDTVPNIDDFLGYTGVTYKHIMMIMEGNVAVAGHTDDFAVTVQLDETTAQEGSLKESSFASDRYIREHFNLMSAGSPIFTTNATHSFYAWVSTGAVGRMNHATFTILVVFTYGSDSAQGNISLLLPAHYSSPAGGTTSSDTQKSSRELWIQEPETITTQKSACRWIWDQTSAVVTAYFKCNTQPTYSGLTDVAALMCGSNNYQRTCDDVINLARGRNSLDGYVYRTDTTDKVWNLSSIWIINYKCGRPTSGWPSANRTIFWNIKQFGTTAGEAETTIDATAPVIPEANYFITALGIEANNLTTATAQLYAYKIFVERLSAEGGVAWEIAYFDSTHTDPEVGRRLMYSQMRSLFKRFPTDADITRMDLETSRRWRIITPQNIAAWWAVNIIYTYHTITYTLSGTISNSGGGTVNLYLHKGDNVTGASNKGELMQTGSTVGNGSYSFTIYDNVENVQVSAYESSTYKGMSKMATVDTSFDISLSSPASGASNYACVG